MLAVEWGTGQVFWSLVWLFLFTLWLWLLITVFASLFWDRELSGAQKALWLLVLLILPFIGVLIYIVVRGTKVRARPNNQETFDYFVPTQNLQESA